MIVPFNSHRKPLMRKLLYKKSTLSVMILTILIVKVSTAFAKDALTCPDPNEYLCIQLKTDDSVTKKINVGIYWSRMSKNPLWNEYGIYSSFISHDKFNWAITPMSYIKSHQFTEIKYTVVRVNNQLIKHCEYQLTKPFPGQYEMVIFLNKQGSYACKDFKK